VLVLGANSDVQFEPAIGLVDELDFVPTLQKELSGGKFGQVVVHAKNVGDWVSKNITITSVGDDGVICFVSAISGFGNQIDPGEFAFARFTI
jgi:hypothetical protein